MARKKYSSLIIEIHRDRLIACGGSLVASVTIQIPPQVIRDLEVTSQIALENLVHAFVVNQKLAPISLILVLSQDVYFEKEIGKCEGEEKEKLVQQFVDTVPFTTTSEKVFQIRGSCRLVVINRAMYDAFKAAFEKEQFPVAAVIPELVLPGIGIKGALTVDSCRVIAKRLPELRKQSFLEHPERGEGQDSRIEQFFSDHLMALVILLVITVGWAGAMAIVLRQKPLPVSPPEIPILAVTEAPTVTPTEPVATPSANPEEFSIRILNASRKAGLAAELTETLGPYGFTNIETANSQTISDRTTIVFSPLVPDGTRKLMFRIVQESYPETGVGSDIQQDVDIVITIGSS